MLFDVKPRNILCDHSSFENPWNIVVERKSPLGQGMNFVVPSARHALVLSIFHERDDAKHQSWRRLSWVGRKRGVDGRVMQCRCLKLNFDRADKIEECAFSIDELLFMTKKCLAQAARRQSEICAIRLTEQVIERVILIFETRQLRGIFVSDFETILR